MKQNQKLSALLALTLAFYAPAASYANQIAPRGARPTPAALVGLLKSDMILRRQFVAELNALKPGMDLAPLLEARDLGALPATTDRMYRHSTGELMRMVLAHPELVASDPKERKELHAVLKQANANIAQVDLLLKLRQQAQTGFAAKISAIQADMALDSVGDDAGALRGRLDRVIDNARAGYAAEQGALAVVAQDMVSGGAGSSMIQDIMGKMHAARAAQANFVPSPDAGQRFLEEKTSAIGKSDREGVEAPKFAYLKPGEHTPEREAALKAAGVDIMLIGSPTPEELSRLKVENGYFRRGDTNRWVAPAESPQGYLARHRDSGRDILKSWDIPVEVGPLTKEVWDFWYEKIYTPFIKSLPAGQFLAPREFGALTEKYKQERLWYVLFKDPQTGEPLGGIIDGEFPSPKLMWGHFAAYMPAMKERKLYPDLRATWEEMNLARWLGHTIYSAGLDHNFKGWILGRGLLSHKVAMGFELYPAKEFQIVKVLNTAKFQKPAGAEGVDEGVVFFTLTPEMERRYVAAWKEGAAPLMEALFGGDFFAPGVIASAAATVMRHFFTDEAATITPPKGIPVERAPLDSLNGK